MTSHDTPTSEELEQRMRPGALSQDGFLGVGESLEEVLAADRERLRALGVTCDDLASRLGSLISAALNSRRHAARVGVFEVSVVLFTGFQICPWAADIHAGQCAASGGVEFGSVDWRIVNTRTGRVLEGPGLIVHLIRAHGFFEGRQSPHRVEPSELVRLLELQRD